MNGASAKRLAELRLPSASDEGRTALEMLLTRYSVSAKHLREPGPSEDDLWAMAMAALRAPDHEKRIPFRFVVARGEGLERLAALFVDYGRRHGKADAELAREREKAMQAPVVIAVIARIDPLDEVVPATEQWLAVGGAIANAVAALHYLGYGAKMVAGARARDPAIHGAYCGEGEELVGWISAGTPDGPPKGRGEIDPGAILRDF
ncbi:MAG TPA: nitroreductase family protein [Usitatibacteraceae bacterium]|nr:nitroreductase family protein [Usitatibacteraceae bacterium]